MPEPVVSSNKRIAKNTIILYLRMIVTMIVGLFTSRIVLQTLGISDYGVYNVVGGFVTMLSYMNAVFVDANQRFISFSLGEGNIDKLKRIFSTSIQTQLVYVGILFVVAETFGLWFINNKLVISPDRMVAANWVYQCSLATLLMSIMSVPFRSCMVAHEKLDIYALISIVDVVLKLIVVYLLIVIPADKLIVYALLHLMVALWGTGWVVVYCRRRFSECKLIFSFDKAIFKELFSFSGWVLIGNLGFSFKDQISNIMMNMFLGPTINAARGIAMTVNDIVTNFVNNFLMALSPQITKQYASREYEKSKKLVYMGSKYAAFLMIIMIVPLLVNIDYLLELWLGTVPEHTSIFIVITLITTMYFAMSKPLTIAIQATGDIKWFQIGISAIMLIELPIAYFVLRHQISPAWAMAPAIVTNVLGIVYRLFLLCRGSLVYNFSSYIIVLLQCTMLFVIALILSTLFSRLLDKSLFALIINILVSFSISVLLIISIGLDRVERGQFLLYAKKMTNRIKK